MEPLGADAEGPPPPQTPPACKGGLGHIQQALRVLTCHHRLPRSAAASLRAESGQITSDDLQTKGVSVGGGGEEEC